VLNSERPDVQAAAAAELEVQAAILDAMGLGPQDVALLRLRDQLAERGLVSDAGHVRAPGA
jgi:UV DNA damage repair endonuclease